MRTIDRQARHAVARVAAAALIVAIGAAGPSVAGPTRQSPVKKPAATPAPVRSRVDAAMRILDEYALADARNSDQGFPEYRRWLGAVARGIETGSSAPGPNDPTTVSAQAELAPYRRPDPDTKDLETLAAIKQKTSLGMLGRWMAQIFKPDPAADRKIASDYLFERYALPAAAK